MTPTGELTVEADAEITGLNAGETQNFTFSYEVSDGVGGFDTDDITIMVIGQGESTDGILNGTEANDTIDGAYVDIDGDTRNDLGQEINGLGGNDDIYDGAGDDTVYGGAGDDEFFAGAGADHYDGGAGTKDYVHYATSATGVTVDLVTPGNNTGIAAGDSFVGIERIYGSEYDDILVDDGSIGFLRGEGGNDDLTDGPGFSYLRGGAGADIFRFIADGGVDRVYDFELGTDILDVSAWGVTAFSELSLVEVNTRFEVHYGDEKIRLDNYDATDIPSFTESDFVFA